MTLSRFIEAELGAIARSAQSRGTRPLPAGAVDFSSNDYLGLSDDPEVLEAARAALTRGIGPRASALVTGYTASHEALEHELAELEGTEAALVFPTGFAANYAALAAFGSPRTTIFSDALNHASIIDGCRVAARNGARVVVYPHLDLDALADALRADPAPHKLIVTDTVFSMDGDVAPLAELVGLGQAHDAWVMVDEAHATLLFGDRGGGIAERAGVADQVQIHVGTLSKAVGAHGGFVACSRTVREFLVNRARGYVFSTALPVPIVEAARAALRVARRGMHRARLFAHVERTNAALGLQQPGPIFPIVLGSEERSLEAAERLLEDGFVVTAIRPPTVPDGTSRLRLTLSARHTEPQVDALLDALVRRGLARKDAQP